MTPRRTAAVKRLVEQARRKDSGVVMTRGSMHENRENLAESFVEYIADTYGGTRLERQEVAGELLEDVEGALVTLEMIDQARLAEAPELDKIVVAVDPSGSSKESSSEVGILIAGRDTPAPGGHGYVLEDLSGRLTPEQWGRRAVEAYHRWDADLVVGERNYGGDMVKHVVHTVDRDVRYRDVSASRGKHVRFGPVASLYEQGRVHHVGEFPELEDQLTGFTSSGYEGDRSPDRGDAEVWAFFDLLVEGSQARIAQGFEFGGDDRVSPWRV